MTAPILPPPISALSTPPSTGDTANFDARADQHVQEVVALVPQINAATDNVYANAASAFQSAFDAAASLADTKLTATAGAASANSAQSAALAAQSAAGLPALPNAGQLHKTSGVANVLTAPAVLAVNTAYDADTSAGPFSVTLPPAPAIGDWVEISDWAGTFATNILTVLRNGLKIHFQTADFLADIKNLTVRFVYTGTVKGWAAK